MPVLIPLLKADTAFMFSLNIFLYTLSLFASYIFQNTYHYNHLLDPNHTSGQQWKYFGPQY